jgi:hypothetical protein
MVYKLGIERLKITSRPRVLPHLSGVIRVTNSKPFSYVHRQTLCKYLVLCGYNVSCEYETVYNAVLVYIHLPCAAVQYGAFRIRILFLDIIFRESFPIGFYYDKWISV